MISKIRIDVFPKPTNSFSYTTLIPGYPKKNICNLPKGIVLRLRRICDYDATFDKISSEYQNYLIAREHEPSKVKWQFSEVRNKTRAEEQKEQDRASDVKFMTTVNLAFSNINEIIQNYLSFLHTDESMKKLFPPNSLTTLYTNKKRNFYLIKILRNFKEFYRLPYFHLTFTKNESSISSCIN